MFHHFACSAVWPFRTQLTDLAPWTRPSRLALPVSGSLLVILVCRLTSRGTFFMTESLAVLHLSTLAQLSSQSLYSLVVAQPESTSTSWSWTWTRISRMEWVDCALLRTIPPLTLQGGTHQRRLLTLLGGTPTSIMRSYHLTLMFSCLPHPRYPTSLRCQDRSHHDHRLRCYHRRNLCHPKQVPLLDQVCSPLLCRKLRKHLLPQFLLS